MKLCILGGGGFRTPHVYQALLRDRGAPRVDEVALHDISTEHLAGMTIVLRQLAAGFPDAPRVTATTSLEAALEGSDFVFAAVRVGGLEGRCQDERVALELGLLGQETTGAGGLAYALRTVPFMTGVAHLVRRLAPHAWILNFTNPAGIITEAMQAVLGDRVVGICDTPSGLGRRIGQALRLSGLQLDYVGLNHLGWMRRVLHDGVDVLPRLLADDALLAGLEEGQVFGTQWLRALGAIPNEYLYYYYFHREAVRGILAAGQTRGELLRETQSAFWRELPARGDGAASFWRATDAGRSASYMAAERGQNAAPAAERGQNAAPAGGLGYAGVALAVLAAVSRPAAGPETMILNVRNRGAIAGLPPDAVVELPAVVDTNGVHPLATPPPDPHQLGLMQQLKAVEHHTIRAALTGDRTEALLAFALHPLIDSVPAAHQLLDAYIARIPEVAAVFQR